MTNEINSGSVNTVSDLPSMRHILDNLCDMNEDEARRAYAALGVMFDKEGELLLSKTVFCVARIMSRSGEETPQIARENPIVAQTWRGSSPFSASSISAALFHFDVEVESFKVKGVLNAFVKRGVMVKFDNGMYQMVV